MNATSTIRGSLPSPIFGRPVPLAAFAWIALAVTFVAGTQDAIAQTAGSSLRGVDTVVVRGDVSGDDVRLTATACRASSVPVAAGPHHLRVALVSPRPVASVYGEPGVAVTIDGQAAQLERTGETLVTPFTIKANEQRTIEIRDTDARGASAGAFRCVLRGDGARLSLVEGGSGSFDLLLSNAAANCPAFSVAIGGLSYASLAEASPATLCGPDGPMPVAIRCESFYFLTATPPAASCGTTGAATRASAPRHVEKPRRVEAPDLAMLPEREPSPKASIRPNTTALRLEHVDTPAQGPARLELSLRFTALEGRPLPSLAAADWAVEIDGRSEPDFTVRWTADATQSVALVMAIDASAGVGGERLKLARNAVSALADRVGDHDVVALTTIGAAARPSPDSSSDVIGRGEAVHGIHPVGGATLLHEGLLDAVAKASAAPSARGAVLLVASSETAADAVALEEAVQEAQRRAVSISVLSIGNESAEEPLRHVARATGGRFLRRFDEAALSHFSRAVLEDLRGRYLVTIPLIGTTTGKHRFSVICRSSGETDTVAGTFVARSAAGVTDAAVMVDAGSPRLAGDAIASSSLGEPPAKSGNAMNLAIGLVAMAACVCIAATVARARMCERGASAARRVALNWSSCVGGAAQQHFAAKAEPRPGRGPAWLDVIESPLTSLVGSRYHLSIEDQHIGRSTDSAVPVRDGMVSGVHASIGAERGGAFTISDAQSTNGTFVNNRRITRRTMLRTGDTIRVGRTVLAFVDHRVTQMERPARPADATLVSEQVDPLRSFP